MDTAQRTSMNTDRGRLFGSLCYDVGAHLSEWRNYTIHRAPRERGIADEATFKRLPGEQTGEKSHCCTGISAIDFLFRRREHTFFSVDDEHVRVRLFDLDSQSAEGVHRAHAIFARKKSAQCARAIGQGRNNNGAMGNAFVAWDGDLSVNSRRSFNSQFHRLI